ncbi:MAG: hypothetical protein EOO88_54385 [Pedobacter sp.]|nr:MAG: hypothetical protein EOO88_54385 [Pedobacter sp.]
MKIYEIISVLETLAPPALQEDYDNAGLITGNAGWECIGAVVCLDATEDVVKEAMAANCNLIIVHHQYSLDHRFPRGDLLTDSLRRPLPHLR